MEVDAVSIETIDSDCFGKVLTYLGSKDVASLACSGRSLCSAVEESRSLWLARFKRLKQFNVFSIGYLPECTLDKSTAELRQICLAASSAISTICQGFTQLGSARRYDEVHHMVLTSFDSNFLDDSHLIPTNASSTFDTYSLSSTISSTSSSSSSSPSNFSSAASTFLVDFSHDYAEVIATSTMALVNFLAIHFLYVVFGCAATRLTTLECHRTTQKHKDSLIVKLFVFDFINHFMTLFYIALFKGFFWVFVRFCK